MDHTPIDRMLTDLEESDPAEAPDIADAAAAALAELLDEEEGGEDPAPTTGH